MFFSVNVNKICFIKITSFFCILLLFSGYVFAFAEDNKVAPKFILTDEEQAYLDTLRKRPIKVAYSYDLLQGGPEEEPYGMLYPVLNVLRKEFGLEIRLIKTDWQNAFTRIENGSIDFYGPIAISESRRQKYITVDPFYRNYSKMVTHKDEPINSMLGLNNRSIGLLKGSVISTTMQAYLGPNGKIIYYPTMDAMIDGLEGGVIDAFATVDNAEFEIMRSNKVQFEFSIDNYYVDQGFISGNEDMRTLAALLSRYLKENPQVIEEIAAIREQALFKKSQQRFADEIAYLQTNYDEIVLFADTTLYPLCYKEGNVIKGMQIEINEIFEQLTDIKIRIVSDDELQNGISSALEYLRSGDCMAFVGGFYNNVIWKPRDIVGGDIYWIKTFDEGTLLCVCDCTGHGTPGALLTMLVVSAFEDIVNECNYKDTANVICELDQRIATVLNANTSDSMIKDGCDLAVLYIRKDGGVTVSSANTHVFVCDGKEVLKIKGQKIYIGEGNIKSKYDVNVSVLPPDFDNKFYIASDGLYDQMGGVPKRPFGYKIFEQIILEYHNEEQSVISGKIWEAFENHRGSEIRRDDFQLITFKPQKI